MSNNTSDYSFLIQSIEGKLSAASNSNALPHATGGATTSRPFVSSHNNPPILAPETPAHKSQDLSLSAIAANTSAKKRRISELIMEDADTEDFTMNTRDFKVPSQTRNFSSHLKLQTQVDELKLINEQLKDQLKSYKTEHDLFKDQSARQLKFLEDLNAKYKSDLDVARQKYYDEKKKWQTKLRESEDNLKKLQERLSVMVDHSSPDTSFARPTAASSAASTEALRRIQSLETVIADTQAEARRNLQSKLEADQKVLVLEQQLKLAGTSQTADHDDLAVEHRQLRKQYQELETLYRRKSKEADKLQQMVKNQNMLEEELASTTTKLSLAQDTIKSFQSMEIDHRRVLEERKTWHQVFHTLLSNASDASTTNSSSSSGSSSASAEDVSATRAVTWVQETQQKCLLLQSQVGDLERTITTLRQTLLKSEARCLQIDKERIEYHGKYEKLDAKQHLWTQQSRLYESELTSLRTLLQSFDLEFSIGKPDAAKLMNAKETMITVLRQEVDEARRRVTDLTHENSKIQSSLEQVQQENLHLQTSLQQQQQQTASSSTVSSETMKKLQEKYKVLEEVSGVDFVPHQTRVLHFKYNPTAENFRAVIQQERLEDIAEEEPEDLVSSMPSDVIKRYRIRTKQLEEQLRLATEALTKLQQQHVGAENHSTGASSTAMVVDHVAASAAGTAGSQSPNASMMYFGTNTSTFLPSSNKPATATATASSSSSSSSSGAGNVVDQAKLNQRLKEMFKEKISTFREAVYLLTGYKMELYTADIASGRTVNRLKIRSMYAEAPEDCLIFQLTDNGPELLETEFAQNMDETLIQHLQRYQSVPAFLANVTLTLFENSTFMG